MTNKTQNYILKHENHEIHTRFMNNNLLDLSINAQSIITKPKNIMKKLNHINNIKTPRNKIES